MTRMEKEILRLLVKIQKEIVTTFPAPIKAVKILSPKQKDRVFGFYHYDDKIVHIRLKDADGTWLPMEEIVDTLAHEISHAHLGPEVEHGHGRKFRETYLKIMKKCLKHV